MSETRKDRGGTERVLLSEQGHGYVLVSDVEQTKIDSVSKDEWESWEIVRDKRNKN